MRTCATVWHGERAKEIASVANLSDSPDAPKFGPDLRCRLTQSQSCVGGYRIIWLTRYYLVFDMRHLSLGWVMSYE